MRYLKNLRRTSAIAMLISAATMGAGASSAGADPGASSGDRPFHVSIQADATVVGLCAPGVPLQELSGSGDATHMGRITVTGQVCAGGDGVALWTAANGDSLVIDFSTVFAGPPNPDGSIPVYFPANDVSGTGRFADVALGNLPLEALVTFDASGNSHIDAWLDSTISYNASDRSQH